MLMLASRTADGASSTIGEVFDKAGVLAGDGDGDDASRDADDTVTTGCGVGVPAGDSALVPNKRNKTDGMYLSAVLELEITRTISGMRSPTTKRGSISPGTSVVQLELQVGVMDVRCLKTVIVRLGQKRD